MTYTVTREVDLVTFRHFVEPILRTHEAANNLILGLLNQTAVEEPPDVMVYVEGPEGIALVAIKTDASHPLILSWTSSTEPTQALASFLSQAEVTLSGVLGPRESAAIICQRWVEDKKATCALVVQERIYEIQHVHLPQHPVNGKGRWAEALDTKDVVALMSGFTEEALQEPDSRQVEATVQGRLDAGFPLAGYWLWEEENQVVSIAGYSGPTGTGIRLGPVYTPPHRRGKGYGSWVVATLTESLLQSEYRRVFLFTDLANPTSNAIYQRIGYQPVIDVDHYVFTA